MKLFRNRKEKKQNGAGTDIFVEQADELDMDDEEFLMAEEILGYDSCGSFTRQSCMNDCASEIAMPTITTLN